MSRKANPWAALFALCIGFFMILLDATIVSVAIPNMLQHLNAGLNSIIWVTSVYLLTYAVPMLFTSRLGDRFGPRRIFLIGLFVFTASSLWCGLSNTAGMLIAARAVQGLGAAIMTPQTLTFITHLFPPAKRGAPMGMWGGVAGLATVAGPLLGGLLVDNFGWQWIFYVNVPFGVIGFIATLALVPNWQPKHLHSFDVLGILLSCAGLFCLVFGIQNGQQYNWGKVVGFINIPSIIGTGVVLLVVFVIWQSRNKREPLMPMRLFRIRNFTAGNTAIITVGFALIGMMLPLMIYIQSVLGYSPMKAGLLVAPMSLLSGIVAPFVGRLSDRFNGKYLGMFGLVALAGGIGAISLFARPGIDPWQLTPELLACGLGIGFIFTPLSTVTMNSVERTLTGAASGVYNTTRQIGSVLGSAAIGVLLQARSNVSLHNAAVQQSQQLPEPFRQQFVDGLSSASAGTGEFGATGPKLPPGIPAEVAGRIQQLGADAFHTGFTDAARVTLLLPAAVLLLGAFACLAMKRTVRPAATAAPAASVPAEPDPVVLVPSETTLPIRVPRTRRSPAEAARSSTEPVEQLVHGVVRQTSGSALPGAALTLVDGGGRQIGRTNSDAEGHFRLRLPGSGGYVLIASATAFQPVAQTISVDGHPIRVDVVLAGAAGVTGFVRSVRTHAAVAGAMVTVADSLGQVVDSRVTDPDGRYEVIELSAGHYTLVISAPRCRPVAIPLAIGDDGLTTQDVELETVGEVHGVARDRDGKPISEAKITMVNIAGRVMGSTVTDGTGQYSFGELTEGTYTVIASGYPPTASQVRLASGEHASHDILLTHTVEQPVGKAERFDSQTGQHRRPSPADL